MDVAELVARAEQSLGIEGDAALASALGLSGYSAPQRVRRWRSGENEPDYKATLALLEAAGLLREEHGATNLPGREIAQARRAISGLAEALGALEAALTSDRERAGSA